MFEVLRSYTRLMASCNREEEQTTVRTLAQKRALAVREYLTQRQLPSERLFMGAANTTPTQDNWQPRVELSLEQD